MWLGVGGVSNGFAVGGKISSAFCEDPDDGVEEPGDNGDVHGLLVGSRLGQGVVPGAKLVEDGDEVRRSPRKPTFHCRRRGGR